MVGEKRIEVRMSMGSLYDKIVSIETEAHTVKGQHAWPSREIFG